MAGQPGAATGAPGDQNQPAQTAGGQPDYTKAWEEYYKKIGMSKLVLLFCSKDDWLKCEELNDSFKLFTL